LEGQSLHDLARLYRYIRTHVYMYACTHVHMYIYTYISSGTYQLPLRAKPDTQRDNANEFTHTQRHARTHIAMMESPHPLTGYCTHVHILYKMCTYIHYIQYTCMCTYTQEQHGIADSFDSVVTVVTIFLLIIFVLLLLLIPLFFISIFRKHNFLSCYSFWVVAVVQILLVGDRNAGQHICVCILFVEHSHHCFQHILQKCL